MISFRCNKLRTPEQWEMITQRQTDINTHVGKWTRKQKLRAQHAILMQETVARNLLFAAEGTCTEVAKKPPSKSICLSAGWSRCVLFVLCGGGPKQAKSHNMYTYTRDKLHDQF